MTVFKGVIQEELERAKSHVRSYETMLSKLPKGYVSIVTISGKRFAYLKWREGTFIKSKYIGIEGSKEEKEARNNYLERKRIKNNLLEAKKEQIKLEKMMKLYKNN